MILIDNFRLPKKTKKKLQNKKNFLRTDEQTDGLPKTIVRNLTKNIDLFLGNYKKIKNRLLFRKL